MAMYLVALSSLGVAAAGTAAIPASHSRLAPGALPPFGTEWIVSDASKVNLSVIDDTVGGQGQVLRWTKPSKPTVLMTYLPNKTSVSKPGEKFVLSFGWRSDGENKCDPFDFEDGKTCSCGQKLKEQCLPGKGTPSCAKTSVNCIEGTGDFRIAIWDTHLGTASPPKNNFCPEGNPLHTCMDAIGAGFKEYKFNIMPHVSTTYYHPKDSEPGGFFAKINESEIFDDSRLPGHWGHTPSGVFPGFGVPRGQWVNMEISVERVNTTTFNVAIAMDTAQYKYQHTWPANVSDDMPELFDAFGIWFPNSRSYSYVDFAPITVRSL